MSDINFNATDNKAGKEVDVAANTVLVDENLAPTVSALELVIQSGGDTNGSTTFVDNSTSPKTIVANGTVQHATDQAKFGTSSIKFPSGGGNFLSMSDFAAADPSARCWVRGVPL